MPKLLSVEVSTAPSMGSLKLGHPVPLSNLSFDSNSDWRQPAHENLPGRFSHSSAQLPGASMPCWRITAYCSGVRMRRHSSSPCVTGYVLLSIRRSSIADQPAPLRSSVAPSPRCRQWTLCRNQHRYGYNAASRLGSALQLGITRRRTLEGDSAISPDRPHRPSLALDPGQSVLDPGLRPGAPRHGEELDPLLDVEVRVHPGRDEIHSGGDAVLRGSRRDFIERSLIDVALVVEWHPQLDRKIGWADQQDVDARDRGDGIE